MIRSLSLFLLVATLASCAMPATRLTSTKRTAVERALLTESLNDALGSLQMSPGEGRTIALESGDLQAEEKDYLLFALREKFLENGYAIAKDRDSADIIIYPRTAYNNTDENNVLIGLPKIDFQLLGTPEIALYKAENQRGRSQVSFTAVEREGGALLFADDSGGFERMYNNYRMLFVFKWRSTDLSDPF